MKAVLDHIGIAVKDLQSALVFYRDALGLEIEGTEEVASQQVRVHFASVGEPKDRGTGAPGVKLELLEATSAGGAARGESWEGWIREKQASPRLSGNGQVF